MHVCMTTTHNFCVLGPNTLTPGNTVQTLTLTKFFENHISLHCLFILDFSSLVILSALSYGLVDHKVLVTTHNFCVLVPFLPVGILC